MRKPEFVYVSYIETTPENALFIDELDEVFR